VSRQLADTDSEIRAVASIRLAIVERWAKRFTDALRIYTDTAPLFEKSNHSLRGRFHIGFANVLLILSEVEGREDYRDRALVEYSAASFHFDQAGHERYLARVENNLGFLFSTIGNFSEAHEHLNRARRIFSGLKDKGSVAQVDDTRAKVLLAEGRSAEAEGVVRSAVQMLEKGGEQSLLAEALTTYGTALARTSQHLHARLTLQRAVSIAEQAGDRKTAGDASLTFIEELSEHSTPAELNAIYEHADELFAQAQHPAISKRLKQCAHSVLRMFVTQRPQSSAEEFNAPASWEGFSLKREVRRYERFLIERALGAAGGQVTRASRLLGFKSHGSLIEIINKWHQDLLSARTPVVHPRRSINTQRLQRSATKKEGRGIKILYVEDNKLTAETVKETLEMAGWKVRTCDDAKTTLRKIQNTTHYDLLLLDNDLPEMSGIEIARHARHLSHRRGMPIILLSTSDCEGEARRAGVDVLLRDPEDDLAIASAIARLLAIMPRRS
jgi:two-component system chemotaxis response regulator CheY